MNEQPDRASEAPNVASQPPPHLSARERRIRWMTAQQSALRGYTRLPSVRHVIAWFVPGALLALWLIGILLRLFTQDRLQELAYYYYATPPIVLTILAALASGWCLIGRHWQRALVPVMLTLGSAIWAYRATWYHHTPAACAGSSLRIVFWNAAHGTFGWARVADRIRAYDADVVALDEGSDGHSDMAAVWHDLLPEYRALLFDTGITLLTRVAATPDDKGMLGGDRLMAFGWYAHCEVALPTGPLQLVLVDFHGTVKRSRYLPMHELQRRLEPLADQPVLIVGDMNMPTDSVFLKPLRQNFRNAFESAGSGYAATWPIPVPLLVLDQAWYNDGVQVSRCELGWSWISDHRALMLDVAVRK
jgi:vancomycin resistance protein VanJ